MLPEMYIFDKIIYEFGGFLTHLNIWASMTFENTDAKQRHLFWRKQK